MAFDAGYLAAICCEIQSELSDSRMDRITQCTRDTFVLEFRAAKKPRALFISAGPSGGLCYLTERKISRPETPPMFCMLLRKHLAGGRFVSARQIGFERVMRLEIEFVDAFGMPLIRYLYLEAMGKNSNLILCDEENRILGALRTLDLAQNPDRPLLCGMVYEIPPARQGTRSLLDEKIGEHILDSFARADLNERASAVLIDCVSGVAPVVARELIYRASGSVDTLVGDLDKTRLVSEVIFLRELVLSQDFRATSITDPNSLKPYVEYSYFPLSQYSSLEEFGLESPSRLLDLITGKKEEQARFLQRAEQARSVLRSATKRLTKKLDVQLGDFEIAKNCDTYRLYGDLITQEIWRLKRGDVSLDAVDYSTGNIVRIELDNRLSPSQNAQRFYKQYQKQKRALHVLEEQIMQTRNELEYAASISAALEDVQSFEEAEQICREVSSWEYGRRFSNSQKNLTKKSKKEPALHIQVTESPSGLKIFFGRNNLQNEEVTFHLAFKNDFWFHIKNRPGPHVVLHLEGGSLPTDADLIFAAKLAIPLNCDGICQVDYTRVKNVKHHSSRLPGRVIYTEEKALFVSK